MGSHEQGDKRASLEEIVTPVNLLVVVTQAGCHNRVVSSSPTRCIPLRMILVMGLAALAT